MLTKKVECPYCKSSFTVQNLKDKLEVSLKCPKCKAELIVKFKPQAEPVEAHTYLGGSKPINNSYETQLGGGKMSSHYNANNFGETQLGETKDKKGASDDETSIGGNSQSLIHQVTAHLTYGDVKYPLYEGRNIIGRKGNTSKATVQIATMDMYMSRSHCVIDVKLLPDGTQKAILSNYHNKNNTTIDGMQVMDGDAIRLMDGNSITMGCTTIKFLIK